MTDKLLKFPSAITLLEDLIEEAKKGHIKELLIATTSEVNGGAVRFSRTAMTIQQQLYMAMALVDIGKLEAEG